MLSTQIISLFVVFPQELIKGGHLWGDCFLLMTEHLQPYGEIQFRHIKGTQLTFFNGILNEIRGEQGNAAIQLCQFHGGDGVPEIKPRLDEVGEGVFGVLIGHIGEIELLICDNHIIFRDFRQSDYGLFRQRASGGSHKDIMRLFQDGFDEIFCPSLIMDNEGKIDLILGKHALREKNIIGCFTMISTLGCAQ